METKQFRFYVGKTGRAKFFERYKFHIYAYIGYFLIFFTTFIANLIVNTFIDKTEINLLHCFFIIVFLGMIATSIVLFVLHKSTRRVGITPDMISLASKLYPRGAIKLYFKDIEQISVGTEEIIISGQCSDKGLFKEKIVCKTIAIPIYIENIDELVVLLRKYCGDAFME